MVFYAHPHYPSIGPRSPIRGIQIPMSSIRPHFYESVMGIFRKGGPGLMLRKYRYYMLKLCSSIVF